MLVLTLTDLISQTSRRLSSSAARVLLQLRAGLYQELFEIGVLVFRVFLVIRPAARLANIVYGFSNLFTQMHPLKDFLPFSSELETLVAAVEDLGLAVVRLLVVQAGSLLLDLYVDELEIKLRRWDELVSHYHHSFQFLS
jgi:hypothetical protein